MGESFTIVTEIALGLIALTIGGEFYWGKLKRMGSAVVVITVVQLLGSFTLVALGLWVFRMELAFALLLGAIASATAPAATVAIVQSLRAKGLFVDYLYGVVALDDAGCVVLFGVIFAFASTFLKAGEAAGIEIEHVFQSLGEVSISLLIGALGGALLHLTTRRKKNTNEIMILSIGIVFLSSAIAIVFHLSPLLTNMAAGAVLINLSTRNHRVFRILEPLTPPVYALFFVIAGTELRLGIMLNSEILLLGLLFVALRALGKYGGVYLGCRLSRTSVPIRRYLGLCMLPQAGVAIGLVLLIQASPATEYLTPQHRQMIDTMVNVVLLSVFVSELLGPPLSRLAIIRGNEMEA
jgi:Kef-type K+ transport system membrane component KefB